MKQPELSTELVRGSTTKDKSKRVFTLQEVKEWQERGFDDLLARQPYKPLGLIDFTKTRT